MVSTGNFQRCEDNIYYKNILRKFIDKLQYFFDKHRYLDIQFHGVKVDILFYSKQINPLNSKKLFN